MNTEEKKALVERMKAQHVQLALDRFMREKVVKIGMQPLRSEWHDEIFQIQKIESGLTLQSTFAGTSNRLSPDARILFRLHHDAS